MTKTYRFAVRGGATVNDEGKTRYPDYVIVEMGRDDAWRAVRDLLNYLADDKSRHPKLSWLGQLAFEEEGE